MPDESSTPTLICTSLGAETRMFTRGKLYPTVPDQNLLIVTDDLGHERYINPAMLSFIVRNEVPDGMRYGVSVAEYALFEWYHGFHYAERKGQS